MESVNPADNINKAGSPYKGYLALEENVTQINRELKIYRLNGGDEGVTVHRYAFELEDKGVIVTVPSFYDGVSMLCPDSGCKANDKVAYSKFATSILDSISRQ